MSVPLIEIFAAGEMKDMMAAVAAPVEVAAPIVEAAPVAATAAPAVVRGPRRPLSFQQLTELNPSPVAAVEAPVKGAGLTARKRCAP